MKPIFIDTSGWIALVNLSDSLNRKAAQVYAEKYKEGNRFVTHQGIILEVGNSLSGIHLRQTAIGLKEKIENSSRIEEIEINNELYQTAWKLYAERLDKNWGIVDCISFVIMQKSEITEALTADRHFEQAGFRKLL